MKRGFTLIEVLLYVGISAVLFSVALTFLLGVVLGNVKKEALVEVQENGRFASERILGNVRNAQRILTPAVGKTSSRLSLEMAQADISPTIFELVDGVLRIQQGTKAPVALTSSKGVVSSLGFLNGGPAESEGSVLVEITISHRNQGGLNVYTATGDFSGAAAIRAKP